MSGISGSDNVKHLALVKLDLPKPPPSVKNKLPIRLQESVFRERLTRHRWRFLGQQNQYIPQQYATVLPVTALCLFLHHWAGWLMEIPMGHVRIANQLV